MHFFETKKVLISIGAAAIITAVLSVFLFVIPDAVRAHASAAQAEAAASTSSAAAGTDESEQTDAGKPADSDGTGGLEAVRSDSTGSKGSGSRSSDKGKTDAAPDTTAKIGGFDPSDWKYTLVNKEHLLPEGYEVEVTDLDDPIFAGRYYNGDWCQADARCESDLVQMFTDCVNAGLSPMLTSGYRPHETQVMLFENKVNSLAATEDISEEQAIPQAAEVVATPGTSEHELGLALDITSAQNANLDDSQEQDPTQQWLMQNSWKYGFILRYPKDKTDLTGIIYEPWHYRYVGRKAAAVMHEKGLCLEEFVQAIS